MTIYEWAALHDYLMRMGEIGLDNDYICEGNHKSTQIHN